MNVVLGSLTKTGSAGNIATVKINPPPVGSPKEGRRQTVVGSLAGTARAKALKAKDLEKIKGDVRRVMD